MDVAAAPWAGSRPAASRPSWQPHDLLGAVPCVQDFPSRLVQLRVAVERLQDSLSGRLASLLDRLGDLSQSPVALSLADQLFLGEYFIFGGMELHLLERCQRVGCISRGIALGQRDSRLGRRVPVLALVLLSSLGNGLGELVSFDGHRSLLDRVGDAETPD